MIVLVLKCHSRIHLNTSMPAPDQCAISEGERQTERDRERERETDTQRETERHRQRDRERAESNIHELLPLMHWTVPRNRLLR